MPLSLRDDDREMEILMAKAEWGVKRTCSSCRARFYDLAREPVVCPKCGAELDISAPVKPKRIKPGASGKTAPVAAAVTADTDLIDDEDELEEDIDDDDAERHRDCRAVGAVKRYQPESHKTIRRDRRDHAPHGQALAVGHVQQGRDRAAGGIEYLGAGKP